MCFLNIIYPIAKYTLMVWSARSLSCAALLREKLLKERPQELKAWLGFQEPRLKRNMGNPLIPVPQEDREKTMLFESESDASMTLDTF